MNNSTEQRNQVISKSNQKIKPFLIDQLQQKQQNNNNSSSVYNDISSIFNLTPKSQQKMMTQQQQLLQQIGESNNKNQLSNSGSRAVLETILQQMQRQKSIQHQQQQQFSKVRYRTRVTAIDQMSKTTHFFSQQQQQLQSLQKSLINNNNNNITSFMSKNQQLEQSIQENNNNMLTNPNRYPLNNQNNNRTAKKSLLQYLDGEDDRDSESENNDVLNQLKQDDDGIVNSNSNNGKNNLLRRLLASPNDTYQQNQSQQNNKIQHQQQQQQHENRDKEFYLHYKNMDFIKEASSFLNDQVSPFAKMLSEQENQQRFPKKLGIVQSNNNMNSLSEQYLNYTNNNNGPQTSLSNIKQQEVDDNRLQTWDGDPAQLYQDQKNQNTSQVQFGELKSGASSPNYLRSSQTLKLQKDILQFNNINTNNSQYQTQQQFLFYQKQQQQQRSQGRRVQVKHFNIGDSDARPFAEGLNEIDELEAVEAGHNRFTDLGAGEILKRLKPSTQSLDLSYNCVTALTCQTLALMIAGSSQHQLKELNLEGNHLSDAQAQLLLPGLGGGVTINNNSQAQDIIVGSSSLINLNTNSERQIGSQNINNNIISIFNNNNNSGSKIVANSSGTKPSKNNQTNIGGGSNINNKNGNLNNNNNNSQSNLKKNKISGIANQNTSSNNSIYQASAVSQPIILLPPPQSPHSYYQINNSGVSSRLRKLNLSRNRLSNAFCTQLKPVLAANPQLTELYLYWNLFTSAGGRALAEGLMTNDYLRVLDLSHNAMGQGAMSCAVAWEKLFAKDRAIELLHVDFSFNHFGDADCRVIGEGLRKNHTIYGFHFQGNFWGEIDCHGFLIIPQMIGMNNSGNVLAVGGISGQGNNNNNNNSNQNSSNNINSSIMDQNKDNDSAIPGINTVNKQSSNRVITIASSNTIGKQQSSQKIKIQQQNKSLLKETSGLIRLQCPVSLGSRINGVALQERPMAVVSLNSDDYYLGTNAVNNNPPQQQQQQVFSPTSPKSQQHQLENQSSSRQQLQVTSPGQPQQQQQVWSHASANTSASQSKSLLLSNCWICEGWIEKKFCWKPLVSGPVDKEPIYIHFSTDDFAPHLMVRNTENNNVFEYTMMFPPLSKVYYFFTAQGNQVTALEQMKEQNPRDHITVRFADSTVTCYLSRLNYVKFGAPIQIFSHNKYDSLVQTLPRVQEPPYSQPKKESIKIVWSMEKSLFKECVREEPQELVTACFDSDFRQSRIFQLVQSYQFMMQYQGNGAGDDEDNYDQQQQQSKQESGSGNNDKISPKNSKSSKEMEDQIYNEFKQYLLDIYPQIKALYKYLSSISPAGDCWNVAKSAVKEFIAGTKIVDGWLVSNSDVDQQFRACFDDDNGWDRMGSTGRGSTANYYFNSGSNNNNTTRSAEEEEKMRQYQLMKEQLFRHQFLELFVRLAINKYIKNSIVPNILEAVKRLFVIDGVEQAISKLPNAQTWRDKYFWSEKCDFCLQFYKPVLETIYKYYLQQQIQIKGQAKSLHLHKSKFLGLAQFKQMISNLGLSISEKDINLAFNYSVGTQVDEITKTKHLELNFIEFIEAVARISEIISIAPYGFESNEDFWTADRIKHLPLHVLIESLCILMFKKIAYRQLTPEEFFLPDESLFHVEILAVKENRVLFQRAKNVIQNKVIIPNRIVSQMKSGKSLIENNRRFSRKSSIIDPKQVAKLIQQHNSKKNSRQLNQLTVIKQFSQN